MLEIQFNSAVTRAHVSTYSFRTVIHYWYRISVYVHVFCTLWTFAVFTFWCLCQAACMGLFIFVHLLPSRKFTSLYNLLPLFHSHPFRWTQLLCFYLCFFFFPLVSTCTQHSSGHSPVHVTTTAPNTITISSWLYAKLCKYMRNAQIFYWPSPRSSKISFPNQIWRLCYCAY